MRLFLTFCLCFFCLLKTSAQQQVHFNTAKRSVKLPFKLVSNLIIVPIKVNGVALNFLLDTGVEETILFSLEDTKELELYEVEKIRLKGLGSQDAIEGLKSYKNKLTARDLEFRNQEIVVVLDESFNFSSTLGIEVNGIIGYQFFSENLIEIDYKSKRIIVYNSEKINKKKMFSKFKAFDFTLENGKPYLNLTVDLNGSIFDAKCLVDSGNSDGLWLFTHANDKIKIPKLNFEDYLGRGFSGDIFGKKAKVDGLSLGEFKFEEVVTAFPDSLSLANVKMVESRLGSIGGEVLRRFDQIFDYQNKKLYLRKNKHFNEKFHYNTTGITIQHSGIEWYKEEVAVKSLSNSQENPYKQENRPEINYNFKLLPVYEILSIRTNSPAEKAGLQKGDVLLSINGIKVYRLGLDSVNRLLQTNDQSKVKIVITRNDTEFKFEFKVIDLL
ncbi:PDZ domain-containing protein [Flavobacterium antarcticum]|uniref:PDZ domain-containing protein n=1 Tax=Flavobacterium antarcticum TaxID=271155 RepID=UPI0004793887|nr:PDZ domain-containing protein [Flavobacterium antarcticum]